MSQNNRGIIYLRKEGDIEDDFDHEEFKISLQETDTLNEESTEDIQTEDIVKIRVKKQEKWEQHYDVREQKTDMFNQLIQQIPKTKREAKRKDIDKLVDLLFDLLEDVRSKQLYKGSNLTSSENIYYKDYLNHNYNLDWLIPVIIDTTVTEKYEDLTPVVQDKIREQLRSKLSSYSDSNKLYYSKHHRNEETLDEYKGDAEYENLIFNGSRKTYSETGITIEQESSEGMELPFDPNKRITIT